MMHAKNRTATSFLTTLSFLTILSFVAILFCRAAGTAQASIVATLDRGENVTITAIGTSLTNAAHSTWFGKMGDWLDSQYPQQVTLYNEGVSSSASKYTDTYTSPSSGLDVQLGKALAHNPDAVFIEFGMNDAYAPYGISVQMSKDNLQTMIDQINSWASSHGKAVDIVVQTMNNDGGSGLRPNLAAYYQGYRDVAAANELLLIDNYANWMNLYQTDPATWRLYVPDGVHPNAEGSDKIILPEIERALMSQAPEPTGMAMLLGCALVMLLVCLWKTRIRNNLFKAFCGTRVRNELPR
jgi:acyl-CoA thioesterase I